LVEKGLIRSIIVAKREGNIAANQARGLEFVSQLLLWMIFLIFSHGSKQEAKAYNSILCLYYSATWMKIKL
jgi:hypothetical protein